MPITDAIRAEVKQLPQPVWAVVVWDECGDSQEVDSLYTSHKAAIARAKAIADGKHWTATKFGIAGDYDNMGVEGVYITVMSLYGEG